MTFYTYIENALKAIKKEPQYANMRVSIRIRNDLSEIVAAILTRIAVLARIIVKRVMNVRTMNADHVKDVVAMLMTDEGCTEAQISAFTDEVDAKLVIYHKHLASERVKKVVPETGEASQKKLETEYLRKKNQVELAKKRAKDAVEKCKGLQTEIASIEPLLVKK